MYCGILSRFDNLRMLIQVVYPLSSDMRLTYFAAAKIQDFPSFLELCSRPSANIHDF
jgi:hypothetical protein